MSTRFVNKNWKNNIKENPMSIIETGTQVIEVEMNIWDGKMSPDMSADLLQAGNYEYDSDQDAYIVDSVDAIIDYGEDWEKFKTDEDRDYIAEYGERPDESRHFAYKYIQAYLPDDMWEE